VRSSSWFEARPESNRSRCSPLREGELERSGLDSSKASEELGWKAEVPLESGIAETYRSLVAEFEASP
jgi:nucleoside-diphosphate-sugar epimerase